MLNTGISEKELGLIIFDGCIYKLITFNSSLLRDAANLNMLSDDKKDLKKLVQ